MEPKFTALREKFGGKRPNIIYVLSDDVGSLIIHRRLLTSSLIIYRLFILAPHWPNA